MAASPTPQPITYFNRYTGRLEQEAIYGESYLRWTYETQAGRLALALAARRVWFSRWYGWRMNRRASRDKVLPFIEQYQVDPEEFAQPPETFGNFNEFFYRKLRPEARPIDPDPAAIVFPADGRQLVLPDISEADGLWVKGQQMDLARLLGDADLARRYSRGSLLISRLCPTDYHRFHFPVGGTARAARPIAGSLSSVSPVALRRRLAILWENKRQLTEIQCGSLGTVLLIEVGAACVGGIWQTYTPGAVEKGAEKGYFSFGGSMTMVLFPPATVRFADDLLEHSAAGREVYARMGDRAGLVDG
ncbi:phosphatidylserine decarboxylase [Roseimaritima sediminicola]|uniref:phosphatidylserine decarboxylase n=1 Tax=Roseimaritima sediminicola TaxID=2662066 RepID=UPI0012983FB9|nr:phosphatidylserine decarboxylase [Roseimaritima sediminicola]